MLGVDGVAEVACEQIRSIERQREEGGAAGAPSDQERVRDTQFSASTRLVGSNANGVAAGVTPPGQVHTGVAEEDAAHTTQVMYSCGSVAPNMRRGGGCSVHGFFGAREGWEHCEGGLLVWHVLLHIRSNFIWKIGFPTSLELSANLKMNFKMKNFN